MCRLSTYEVKLRDLSLRKKIRRNEWLPIWQHCQHIQNQGEIADVILNGTALKWAKVWKEIRQHGLHKLPRCKPHTW